MAIKVQNTTVIDDSRNLTNIAGATISGLATVTVNSANPALTIEQQGSGNCLVVQDEASDTSPFVIDAAGNVIVGNTVAPSTSSNLTIDQSTPELGLRTGGISVNGVSGWSFQNTSGELWIKKQTASDFSTNQRVITFTTDNRIGILRNSPTESLDVQGNMGIHVNDSGFVIAPGLIDSLNHAIIATDTNTATNRNLEIACNLFRLYTGGANDAAADQVFTINDSGAAVFNKSGGGVVTADNFNAIGADWRLLASVNTGAGNAIDFTLPTGFNHFSVVFEQVYFTSSALIAPRLLDVNGNNLSGTAYRFAVASGVSFTAGFGHNRAASNAGNWIGGVFSVNPNSVEGGYSGIMTFYNPRTSNRWKRLTGQSAHYSVVSSTITECRTYIQGDLDSTTVATTIRLLASAGNYAGGVMHLYGIRL